MITMTMLLVTILYIHACVREHIEVLLSCQSAKYPRGGRLATADRTPSTATYVRLPSLVLWHHVALSLRPLSLCGARR